MSNRKLWRVRFMESCGYSIVVRATSEQAALDAAEAIYDECGRDAMESDYERGGTEDWEATLIGDADPKPKPKHRGFP